MRLTTMYLTVLACLAGCATVRDDTSFTVEAGSPCAFIGQHRFALYGTFENGEDPSPLLMREVVTRIPKAILDRNSSVEKVTVQFSTQISGCTHCPPPYEGPRLAFAALSVGDENGSAVRVIWWSSSGVSNRRYAQTLAELLAELHAGKHGSQASCNAAPPN